MVTAKWYTGICLLQVVKNLSQNQKKKELRRYALHHDNVSAHTAEISQNISAICSGRYAL